MSQTKKLVAFISCTPGNRARFHGPPCALPLFVVSSWANDAPCSRLINCPSCSRLLSRLPVCTSSAAELLVHGTKVQPHHPLAKLVTRFSRHGANILRSFLSPISSAPVQPYLRSRTLLTPALAPPSNLCALLLPLLRRLWLLTPAWYEGVPACAQRGRSQHVQRGKSR